MFEFWLGLAIFCCAPVLVVVVLAAEYYYLCWKYLSMMIRIFQENDIHKVVASLRSSVTNSTKD